MILLLAPILATGTTTATVSTFISEVGALFTAVVGWLSSVGTTIMGDPILLTFCAVPLIGLGIGIFTRLLRVN